MIIFLTKKLFNMKTNYLIVIFFVLQSLVPYHSFNSFNQIEKTNFRGNKIDNPRLIIAQNIIDNLVNQQFEAVRTNFSGTLKQQVSPQNIKDLWLNILTQLGKFENVISTRTEINQGYNQVISRCQFEIDKLNIGVTFNEDNEVIGIFYKP